MMKELIKYIECPHCHQLVREYRINHKGKRVNHVDSCIELVAKQEKQAYKDGWLIKNVD